MGPLPELRLAYSAFESAFESASVAVGPFALVFSNGDETNLLFEA